MQPTTLIHLKKKVRCKNSICSFGFCWEKMQRVFADWNRVGFLSETFHRKTSLELKGIMVAGNIEGPRNWEVRVWNIHLDCMSISGDLDWKSVTSLQGPVCMCCPVLISVQYFRSYFYFSAISQIRRIRLKFVNSLVTEKLTEPKSQQLPFLACAVVISSRRRENMHLKWIYFVSHRCCFEQIFILKHTGFLFFLSI